MMTRRAILAAGALFATGKARAAVSPSLAIDPAGLLQSGERIDFSGANTFTAEQTEFGALLRSTPNHSASALNAQVNIAADQLRAVSWTWTVNPLQSSADLRSLGTEDTGATVIFIFGVPSLLNRDVPSIAYTWTATDVPNGTVLPSLRYASLRHVQLRGRADTGIMQTERRDLAADYAALFGKPAPALRIVALFNDNDQTNEPVSALFGPIRSMA